MSEQIDSYFQNPRNEMITFLPPYYQRVLEVGCGAGAFHASLKPDIEYWGVDPSESAERVMSNRIFKFLPGCLENVASVLPSNYFDLVIINDVMEHSPNHEEFLCILKSKMASGGSLVGSVPNVRYLKNLLELIIYKDWAYQQSGGILDVKHLRFFTKKSLIRSLVTSGFIVERCEGINPIWWSQYRFRIYIKKLIFSAFGMFLGRDVPYLQFAFHCKV
jgi:SAM-dependent methyltransferase